MARTARFSGVQKTIAATTAQTLIFPSNEIEGSGVVAYQIAFSGGADIADVSRIRVLASGDLIMDVTPAFLRAWMEGTTRTGFVQATTSTTLLIPLYLPDLPSRDMRDGCQFPTGSQPQVEVDLLNTVPAGAAMIGWAKTDQPALYRSRLYSSVMNVAASQDSARANFSDGGVVRGLIHNTTGVSRARAVVSDIEAYRLPGPQYLGGTWGDLEPLVRVGEAPLTITDPLFRPVTLGIPAASGSSYLEIDTGAAWAGVANELGVWSVVQLQREGSAA